MDNSVNFVVHFSLMAWHFRFMLASLFVLILLGGVIFAKAERISLGSGLYFALQTALTLGYGDIAPKTRLGRATSLAIGFVGLLLFGLIVAKATYALHRTIELSKTF